MSACNANKLQLFGSVFTTPPVSLYHCKHYLTYTVRRASGGNQCMDTVHHHRTCSTYTAPFGGCTHWELAYVGMGPSKPHYHNNCLGSATLDNSSYNHKIRLCAQFLYRFENVRTTLPDIHHLDWTLDRAIG